MTDRPWTAAAVALGLTALVGAAAAPTASATPRAVGLARARLTPPAQAGAPVQVPGAGDYALLDAADPSPARWDPCSPVGYRVNLTGAPPGALADVQTAVARLDAASGLDIVYRGLTAAVPDGVDRTGYPADTGIVVAWVVPAQTPWVGWAPGVAGDGGASWQTWGSPGHQEAQMTSGFVVMNAQFDGLTGGFGPCAPTGWVGTRGELLMHELGHAVGLAHAVGADEIMYPTITRKAAVYGPGDVAGLRRVGLPAGCLPRR